MKRPGLLLILAGILGELLGLWIGWPVLAGILLGISVLAFGAVRKIPLPFLKHPKKFLLSFYFFCFLLVLFSFRLQGEKHRAQGFCAAFPRGEEFTGEILKLCQRETGLEITCKGIILYLDWEGEEIPLAPGNRVLFYGKIQPISPGGNPGEFDPASYYAAKGVYFSMKVRRFEILDTRKHPIAWGLFWLRHSLGRRLENIFPPSQSGILRAMLLGDRSHLDKEVYGLYQRNGIAHVLAISGLHVSFAGLLVLFSLKKGLRAGFSASLFGAFGFLLFYGSLTGWSVSVMRAAGMMSLFFLAQLLGRSYDLLTALSVCGSVVLFLSPLELFGPGFLLSFGAVFALGGPVSGIVKVWGAKGALEKALAAGFFLQMFTLPLMLYFFYTFPVYSILLNLLVIPLLSYVIGFGFLGLLASFWGEGAGRFCGALSSHMLTLMEALCRGTQSLPGNQWIFGRPALWQIGAYYGLLYLFYRGFIKTKKRVLWVFSLLALCLLLPLPKPRRIVFLQVGQGDGIYVHTGGENILIDGGSTSRDDLGEGVLAPFLKSQGISRIHRIFITHSDQDHTNGILYLLSQEKGISIGEIYLPIQAKEDPGYASILSGAKARGCRVHYLQAGDRLKIKEVEIRCVSPGPGSIPEANEQSLVLVWDWGDFTGVFTGDAGEESEKIICERYPLEEADLLKVGHHGSKTASSRAFVQMLHPRLSVVSYGKGNSYGHPSREAMERLRETGSVVLETAREGAITVYPGKEIRVERFWKR